MTNVQKYFFSVTLLIYVLLVFGLNLGEPGVYAAQEGRAGVIARNMIKSGDYMSMTFKDSHTTEKPIFCYWIYAGCCKWLGVNAFAVRLPSALAALATVFLVCWLGGRIYGPVTGFLAGFILSSMVSFVNLGRIARIDMILCFFFTLSMVLFYKAYLENKKAVSSYIYLFYVVLALGVMVKGPVSVLLAGLTILGLAAKRRNWRMLWDMKPVSGFLIGSVIALPWYVYESIKTNGSFAFDFFWNQNMDRFLGLNTEYCEGNRKTVFFYFANIFSGALPWSVFFPFGLWQTRKKLLRFRAETDFLILWIVVVFGFFSFSCIKRGDYILPLYPALAILLARFLTWGEKQRKLNLSRYWIWAWAFLVLVAGVVLSALYSGVLQDFAAKAVSGNTPFVGKRDALSVLQIAALIMPYFWYFVLASLVIFGTVFLCGRFFEKGYVVNGALGLAGISIVLNSIFVQWIQPYTDNTYKSVKDFMQRAEKHIPPGETVAYFKISNMEEAVFYLDRDYNKHWTDKELRDSSGRKLKYRYIFCPPENYDDIPPLFRASTVILESTPEGHQYPMALVGPKGSE